MTVDCLSVNMEEHVEKDAEEVASLPKISRTILDNFGLLTKNQPQQRKKGGVSLAKHLQTCIGSENGQNELKYALVRIIRGLGAPKIVARAGFFSTFMVILTKIVQTNHVEFVKEIFELIKKHLSTGKSNSKSENADISAGQILAYGALLRSRIFFSASPEQQQEILNGILIAGQKRFYLVLLSYEFIIELFDSMEESQFKKLVLPAIKPEICKPFIDQSLDSLYLLFKCKEKYPNVFTEKFLNKNIGSSTIINEKNVKTIADVILIKPSLSTKHPLINVATKAIAESDSDCLIAFFEHMDFLQMKPVYSRHVLVSHLSKLIIEQFKEDDNKKAKIPDLLMPTFIKHTLTYFKEKPSKKDELHQKLHQLFDTIINSIKSQGINSETKLALIRKLLFEPGTFNFEQITKLKVIQQVSSSLDSEGVKELIKIYFEVITDENNRCDTFQNMDRLYAAQMLARLLGHPSLQSSSQEFEEYKTSQMEFLMDISLLETNKYCNVGAELAGHLKSTFYRALDIKVSKLESYKSLFSTLLNHAKEIINKPLRVKLTEEDKQTFNKALEIVEKLELDLKEGSKTKKSKKDLYLVFQVLFMHLSMQIFNDPNMANEAIEELFNCYERVNDSNKKKKKKELADSDSEIEWIEVVTDLFLNLLSHNSHLLRSLVNYVFPYMCQHVTLNSLHQVLSILDPENSSILQKKRKKYGEEDDDDENSDEDDENDDENEKSDEDEDEEDEDEDDDGDEDEFDADETVNDKLRQALREALGTNGYQTDEESVDIDNLSDTEAEKLDKALGKAFKQFKPNLGRRNKQSKSDEALTHFRLRSLDLIEIYIENNPSMLFCLEMILPLLKALEFTVKEKHQQPLQDRIKSIIAKLTGIKKFSSSSENSQGEGEEEVDEKCLTNFLSKIVDQEERESPSIVQEIGESISDANKFILKCSTLKNNKKLKKQLIKKYSEFITEFFNSRDCLIPYVLLKDLCLSMWTGNFKLLPKLCEICFNTEIKLFKRNQGLNLLKILLTNNRLFNTLSNKEKKNEENVVNVNAEEVGVGVSETLTQLFNASSDFLQSLIKDNSNQTNEKYISTLFQILKALKHVSSLPVFKSTMDEAMNWQELGELIRNYRAQTKLSKDAITSFKALCKAIGISHVVKINAKAMKSISSKEGEGEEDEEGNDKAIIMSKEKAEQKRKNRLETLKQKKQARLERLKASSEGLQGISFSKANLEEVKDEYKQEEMDVDDDLNEAAGSEAEDEEEEEERKTKKKMNKKNKRKNSASNLASPQEVEVKKEEEEVVEEPKKKKKKKTTKV